jgi:hypothetical protein
MAVVKPQSIICHSPHLRVFAVAEPAPDAPLARNATIRLDPEFVKS